MLRHDALRCPRLSEIRYLGEAQCLTESLEVEQRERFARSRCRSYGSSQAERYQIIQVIGNDAGTELVKRTARPLGRLFIRFARRLGPGLSPRLCYALPRCSRQKSSFSWETRSEKLNSTASDEAWCS